MTEEVFWTAFETVARLPAWQVPVPWLTPFENARLGRFRVSKRREDWLLGRFTAKRLVQKAAAVALGWPLAPESFEIATESSGAPFVRHVSGERLPLSITISHSWSTAFCALLAVPAAGIGADLELVEPRSERFVRDFFTPAEAAAWEESPLAERPLLANAIWSAKESVLKALGVGLTVDTRGVEIHLSGEPADGPRQPPEGDWRRFDAVGAAGMDIDVDEIPLSGLWTLRGPFVVTLAARLSSPAGKDCHGHDRNERRDGSDPPHGNLRPRAA